MALGCAADDLLRPGCFHQTHAPVAGLAPPRTIIGTFPGCDARDHVGHDDSLAVVPTHTTRPRSCGWVLLPLQSLGGVLLAGATFAILNASLEEFVFRGVLFDALEAEWGTRFSLVTTSVLFALGHLRGYPPGFGGACLAGVFGLALGAMRVRTGGLALPILAHIGADGTIYAILTRP